MRVIRRWLRKWRVIFRARLKINHWTVGNPDQIKKERLREKLKKIW